MIDLFALPVKTCTTCGVEKPLRDFCKQSAKKDGLCPICRECSSKSWMENRDANVARLKRYKQTPTGRAVRLIIDARKRAASNNLVFDLQREKIEEILKIGVCERTGIAFQFESHEKFRNNPFAPSLDKVDPFGNYTHDNIKVVCFAYNIGKNQFSHDEFVEFCQKVVDFNK